MTSWRWCGGRTPGGGGTWGRRHAVRAVAILGLAAGLAGGRLASVWAAEAKAPAPPDYGEEEYGEEPASGRFTPEEKAARKACVICHVFPEPEMADRRHWREQILPRMSVRLGVARPDYGSSPEGELIRERKIYTENPYVPVEQWPLIERYFLERAPDEPVSQDPRPEIKVGLTQFRVDPLRWRSPLPTTTLVKIQSNPGRLFVGDDKTQTVTIFDASGRVLESVPVGNVPTDVVERDGGMYVACVGSFVPTEYYRAEFAFFPRLEQGFGPKRVVLKELPRTTMAEFADFNGDGREDFALCMFGNLTGRFSWFERRADGTYLEHVLCNHSGALNCVARDFNGDGKIDLAVLMAQELEMLLILYNDGQGNFKGDTFYQKPPIWGHVWFEVADVNRDGKDDFIVVNGDNGEYESPLKRFHGIRIYLNEGQGHWEEAFFYPLNGAYKAIARDFDQDGDLDLAAISYFPDYLKQPRESFVYLRNQGGMKFDAFTFRECIAGRWLVMDAGDLDGDGDLDLVLGSYILAPSSVPQPLMDIWRQQGPSALVLRNTLHEPPAKP